MLKPFETKLPMRENMCYGHGVYCNYCKRCDYLYGCWKIVQKEKGRAHDREIFMKLNRIEAIKEAKKREESEKSLRLNIMGNLPHWFFTVTFPKGFPPKIAYEKMIECTEGYDLDGGIAGIEFYSDKAPNGGHLHFHLLAPKSKKYKPSVIIKRVAKVCGVKENFVDCGSNTADFTKRVEYICGLKKDSKVDYCAKDRKWRRACGFTSIYPDLPGIYLGFNDDLMLKYEYAINNLRA